jgi:hypothetical protein
VLHFLVVNCFVKDPVQNAEQVHQQCEALILRSAVVVVGGVKVKVVVVAVAAVKLTKRWQERWE